MAQAREAGAAVLRFLPGAEAVFALWDSRSFIKIVSMALKGLHLYCSKPESGEVSGGGFRVLDLALDLRPVQALPSVHGRTEPFLYVNLIFLRAAGYPKMPALRERVSRNP